MKINIRKIKYILVRGFTLVELLIVIAIISVIASIVVSSAIEARARAANASVKSYLWQARSQVELYYLNNNQSYTSACSNSTIVLVVAGALSNGGDTGSVASRCNNITNEWAVNSMLKSPEGANIYWCVDSSGKAKGEPAELSGATHCA
jgi:prepilin-type N-terminal cleavage/methylation domain-containing protein